MHADIDSVSITLIPAPRVAALVGALVLTGLAAVVLLVARGPFAGESAPATQASVADSIEGAQAARTKPTPAAPEKPAAPVARAKQPRVTSGYPPRIDHALRYSRIVVVSVSVPGGAVDAVLRREARAAASAARAGYVAISAANEKAVSGLVARVGLIPAPAVIIVKRPGVVASTFSVTDAATIAQAVAQARR